MSNVDIFVLGHRNFELPVNNDAYKVLSVGGNNIDGENVLFDNTGDNVSDMNPFYCELTGHYWVWKNYDLKDWVGFCHYRRFFSFLDNVPNFDDYNCDAIIPSTINFDYSLYNQYSYVHNIKDLDDLITILVVKYDVPYHVIEEVLHNRTNIHACNMFVMKKELFKEYCEFLFNVLGDFRKLRNFNCAEDVFEHVRKNEDKYLKDFYPHIEIRYQSEIGGFLGERIFNIWLQWKNINVAVEDFIITEDKYENKLNNDFV